MPPESSPTASPDAFALERPEEESRGQQAIDHTLHRLRTLEGDPFEETIARLQGHLIESEARSSRSLIFRAAEETLAALIPPHRVSDSRHLLHNYHLRLRSLRLYEALEGRVSPTLIYPAAGNDRVPTLFYRTVIIDPGPLDRQADPRQYVLQNDAVDVETVGRRLAQFPGRKTLLLKGVHWMLAAKPADPRGRSVSERMCELVLQMANYATLPGDLLVLGDPPGETTAAVEDALLSDGHYLPAGVGMSSPAAIRQWQGSDKSTSVVIGHLVVELTDTMKIYRRV